MRLVASLIVREQAETNNYNIKTLKKRLLEAKEEHAADDLHSSHGALGKMIVLAQNESSEELHRSTLVVYFHITN